MPVSDNYQLVLDALNNPVNSAIYGEAPAAGFAAADSFAGRSVTLSDERLNALRSGTASGNAGKGLRAWGQIFGTAAHQGERGGMQGFDMYGTGGAAGIDSADQIPKTVVGVSFSYGRSHVNARDPIMTDTSIASYQATLYGDYDLGDHMFMRGLFSYTRMENDTFRDNSGLISRGSYGANEFTTLLKAGKSFKRENMTWTPSMLARWIHYSPEAYDETGSGFHVTQSPLDVLEVGPAMDASWKIKSADGSWFVPSVHAGYRYDLVGQRIYTTYSGGCCGFFSATSPSPAQSRINLGGSLTMYTTGAWEFKAGYDADLKQKFLAHTGIFRGTVRY